MIGEFSSVVKGADGVDLKGDRVAAAYPEGIEMLKAMIQEVVSTSESKDDKLAWSFRTTPLKDFGKTIDDVLLAFLRWSTVDQKSSHSDKSCSLIGGINNYPFSAPANAEHDSNINVSKAFRRLTSYTRWMKSVSSDLKEPLTFESVSPSLSTFSIQMTHDSCDRLVWWINLGKTDMSAFKSQSPRETIRLFIWVAHFLFLDERAQTKGLVVVDDMANVNFYEYMTMLPVNVGLSLDRFLISVTPLKTKNVVLMHLPKWAEIAYSLLSWFLTSKMKSRVTIVADGEESETLKNVVGGSQFIPLDFSDYGHVQTDIIGDFKRQSG